MENKDRPALGEAIARFDRKERGWVIRTALGEKCAKLDPGFLSEVYRCLGLSHSPDAEHRWFIDYHFDWLLGALNVYELGEAKCLNQEQFENCKEGIRQAHGNQEDVDLLIVVGTDIIMVEAKWFGHWNIKQLKSKRDRTKILFKVLADPLRVRPVDLYSVLMSPGELSNSKRLKEVWGSGATPLHLSISSPVEPETMLAVERCDPEPTDPSDFRGWRIRARAVPR